MNCPSCGAELSPGAMGKLHMMDCPGPEQPEDKATISKEDALSNAQEACKFVMASKEHALRFPHRQYVGTLLEALPKFTTEELQAIEYIVDNLVGSYASYTTEEDGDGRTGVAS